VLVVLVVISGLILVTKGLVQLFTHLLPKQAALVKESQHGQMKTLTWAVVVEE
jgi:hypothetical protein